VHRAGYTKKGVPILIKRDDVMALKDKIDYLVDYITVKIEEFKTEQKLTLLSCSEFMNN
jgi:hypothetical protein